MMDPTSAASARARKKALLSVTDDWEPHGRSATSAVFSATVIRWGIGVGIIQVLSPIAFWWLADEVVWAVALVIIAPVYVGFAVADGRKRVVAAEVAVALGFVILAMAGMKFSPWLLVIGLAAHGLKDLWQHRSHFVANTRWWPPFCLVVDVVAAVGTALLLLGRIDLPRIVH
jgi:hypothetical protein